MNRPARQSSTPIDRRRGGIACWGRLLLAFWLVGLAPLPADEPAERSASAEAEAPLVDARAERERLLGELRAVAGKLDELRAEAAGTEAMEEAAARYRELVRAVALEKAPERKAELDRYFEAERRLEQAGGENEEEIREELAALRRPVSETLGEVLSSEPVMGARRARAALETQTMRELDPDADDLMRQHQVLLVRLQRLRQQIQAPPHPAGSPPASDSGNP